MSVSTRIVVVPMQIVYIMHAPCLHPRLLSSAHADRQIGDPNENFAECPGSQHPYGANRHILSRYWPRQLEPNLQPQRRGIDW